VVACYHDDLGVAVWVRGMVGKLQLVAHSVRVKNVLHPSIKRAGTICETRTLLPA
uniref:Uncharacterized protein n=1 Tax=Oryza brachyantha TaxID=4533 RepID=J3MD87_ORYBR